MKTLLLALLLLTGCASMDNNRRDAYVAGAMDCGTTALALAVGQGLVEANPLGPVAACAFKPLAIEYNARKPEPERTRGLHSVEAVWKGFAVNNTAALAIKLAALNVSWTVPVIGGVAFAYWQWHQGADEREFAQLCAYHKRIDPQVTTCTYTPSGRSRPIEES